MTILDARGSKHLSVPRRQSRNLGGGLPNGVQVEPDGQTLDDLCGFCLEELARRLKENALLQEMHALSMLR